MFYLTGDKHGTFTAMEWSIKRYELTENDTMIILGDSGINYFIEGNEDKKKKRQLSKLPCSFLIVRGNHDVRPENIATYKTKQWNGGIVYYEDKFPKLLFAKDGESFNLDGNKVLIIGGAYSVDKDWRLRTGNKWFSDEQLTDEEMNTILDKIKSNPEYDYVLTHAAPFSKQPVDLFLGTIDQSRVDKRTERFLEDVMNCITFKKWYYGHYHGDRVYDNFRVLYHDTIMLGD